MYELYQAEWCPYSHRVRQRLTELGIDYIARQVPASREARTAMRQRTGDTEIPTLIAGDEILVGPEAIFRFLEQHHPRPSGADAHRARDRDPAVAREREEVRREFP
jgi:glutaredoxin 3